MVQYIIQRLQTKMDILAYQDYLLIQSKEELQ